MLQFEDYYSGTTDSLGDGVLNQTVDWWTVPQQPTGIEDHPVFGGFGFARKPMPRYVSLIFSNLMRNLGPW